MERKIDVLKEQVSIIPTLRKEISELSSLNAIATTTLSTLQKELEKQQQYSRRHCIVIDGIPVPKEEKPSDLELIYLYKDKIFIALRY